MSEIKIINIKRDKITPCLYIGRANRFLGLDGSKWENPYPMKNESQRKEVLGKYFYHVLRSPDLMAALPELENMVLGCYCAPKRCHGDVLRALYDVFVLGATTYPDWLEEVTQDGLAEYQDYVAGEIIDEILAAENG